MSVEWMEYGYVGLFLGSFLAATLLPLPSEALLVGALEFGLPPWPILLVATTGNFLGGITNYGIGFWANNERWLNRFPVDKQKVRSLEQKSHRWGYWLGLIAWLPFIGDPMLVALGFLKVRFWPLCATVVTGKFIRYASVVWAYIEISR